MSKKLFLRLTIGLMALFFMLVGILYYRNTVSEAGKRKSPIDANCIQGVKSIRIQGNCSLNGVRGYREAKFECFDRAKGELQSRGCLTGEAFKDAAADSCKRMSKCVVSQTPTPTPFIVEEPTITVVPEESVTPTEEVSLTPSPTICAMPTLPLCEGGTLTASDQPQSPGVCGPKYVCILNENPTPTPEGL